MLKMAEKTIQETNSDQMKERFSFVLTVNGNIVCKRYFRINGFKNESESSVNLCGHHFEKVGDAENTAIYTSIQGALEHCVDLIHKDLVYKSNVYLWNSAPQVFDSVEQMNALIYKPTFRPQVASYVVLRDCDDVYVWTGEGLELYNRAGKPVEPYTNIFNTSDYIGGIENDAQNQLKFAFYDNGQEICSKVWDANVYPRFVRNNIDLSNTKNKYKQNDQFSIVEATLVDLMIKDRQDLIPLIVRELCSACSLSDKNDYVTTLNGYNLNYNQTNSRRYSAIERKLRKKTEEYLKTVKK
jgi:hypothetical protein